LRQLALRKGRELWRGLAVLRSLNGGSRVIGFVLVAVFAQIFRNWLLLDAVGVDASIFDATAVLIAVVSLNFRSVPASSPIGRAAISGKWSFSVAIGLRAPLVRSRFVLNAPRPRDTRRVRPVTTWADRPRYA
jgi:hypothetical protein